MTTNDDNNNALESNVETTASVTLTALSVVSKEMATMFTHMAEVSETKLREAVQRRGTKRSASSLRDDTVAAIVANSIANTVAANTAAAAAEATVQLSLAPTAVASTSDAAATAVRLSTESTAEDVLQREPRYERDEDELWCADGFVIEMTNKAAKKRARELGLFTRVCTEWRLRYKQSSLSGDEWRQFLELRLDDADTPLHAEERDPWADDDGGGDDSAHRYATFMTMRECIGGTAAAVERFIAAKKLSQLDEMAFANAPARVRYFVGGECVRTESADVMFLRAVRMIGGMTKDFSGWENFDNAALHDRAEGWRTAIEALRKSQCSQLGCPNEATCSLVLKKQQCTKCHAEPRVYYEWSQPHGRRFCAQHCTRGDCAVIDADNSYVATHDTRCSRTVPVEKKSRSSSITLTM